MFETIKIILCRVLNIFFSEKKMNACPKCITVENDNYQTNFIIDDPLSRKNRSLTFVDNALHVLYTRVFIRKFPPIFKNPQNYVRPSAMHISNLALIKLMKVLKNNLAKNDIFVISGYGPFIFIRLSKYGLIMAYHCSSIRPRLV